MRLLAIPREENDILEDERVRLSTWSVEGDWTYREYHDALDLLSQIADLRGLTQESLEEIEIIAHGNPATCNDLSLGNVAVIAGSLRRVFEGVEYARVYLSGCNTGLEFNGECIARSFASAYRGPVFGARGYLTGTHAEHSEQCVASFTLDGDRKSVV